MLWSALRSDLAEEDEDEEGLSSLSWLLLLLLLLLPLLLCLASARFSLSAVHSAEMELAGVRRDEVGCGGWDMSEAPPRSSVST